jgi:hypothetical protein
VVLPQNSRAASPHLSTQFLFLRRPPQRFHSLEKIPLATRSSAGKFTLQPSSSSFEVEGEQIVTTIILILGGVLLAALALVYFYA